MKAISKDLHLAQAPNSTVITDTERFLLPLAFTVGYK